MVAGDWEEHARSLFDATAGEDGTVSIWDFLSLCEKIYRMLEPEQEALRPWRETEDIEELERAVSTRQLGMATDDGEGSPTLDRWICRCRGAVDDQPAGGAEPEPHKAEAAEAAVPPEAGWLARLRCCASSPRPPLLPEGVPPS